MHIESMHEELHIGYNIFLFSPSLFRNAAHSLVVSIRDEQNIWKVRKALLRLVFFFGDLLTLENQ